MSPPTIKAAKTFHAPNMRRECGVPWQRGHTQAVQCVSQNCSTWLRVLMWWAALSQAALMFEAVSSKHRSLFSRGHGGEQGGVGSTKGWLENSRVQKGAATCLTMVPGFNNFHCLRPARTPPPAENEPAFPSYLLQHPSLKVCPFPSPWTPECFCSSQRGWGFGGGKIRVQQWAKQQNLCPHGKHSIDKLTNQALKISVGEKRIDNYGVFQSCIHTGLPRRVDSQQRLQWGEAASPAGIRGKSSPGGWIRKGKNPGRTSPAEPQEDKKTRSAEGESDVDWGNWGIGGAVDFLSTGSIADSAAAPSKAGSGGKLSRNLLWWEKTADGLTAQD